MKWSNAAWSIIPALFLVASARSPAPAQSVAPGPALGTGNPSAAVPIVNFFNQSSDATPVIASGSDLVIYQNTTSNYLVVTFFECNTIDVFFPAGAVAVPLIMRLGVNETVMRCSQLNGSWLTNSVGAGGAGGAGPYLAGNNFGMVFPPNSIMLLRNVNGDPVNISYHVTGYFRSAL